MAARLNITIPDDLQGRLQAAKEFQPDLNVSAVCQEAIETAIRFVEVRQSTSSRRQQAIDRLNLQIRHGQREWYSKGREDGLSNAPDLDYEDFSAVIELSNTPIDPLHIIAVQERCRAAKKTTSRLEFPQSMSIAYYAGWIDGVLEFWNDIKDELALNELVFSDANDKAQKKP